MGSDKKPSKIVWITRPEPDASRFAELIPSEYNAIIVPLMVIEPVQDASARLEKADYGRVQAWVMSSANAVRALAEATDQRLQPIITVGEASFEEAQRLGFAHVKLASQDGKANSELLGKFLLQHTTPEGGKILHICGQEVAGNLHGLLHQKGYRYQRVVLYHAKDNPSFSIDLNQDISNSYVMLFSPRSSSILVNKLRQAHQYDIAKEGVVALCLSEAVAAVLREQGWQKIEVAEVQTNAAMLSLLAKIAGC